ncbi:uncharacterized protein MEPE_05415 [Melanopsichium pennsylvanicum]|uniref:Tyrosine specific protein phosphatases domain-containing protein n=1 Tax=Melanopsichium pennsylvanicum TaxID=63383 RepID=A0AAJ4XRS4_9BASI|nr:uncharacterized protein MEPE_05415 [Melanopsichium pennsylvanicum]
MAQPAVQQATLSPPLSPAASSLTSVGHSPVSELSSKTIFLANGANVNHTDASTHDCHSHPLKKTHSTTNGSHLYRRKPLRSSSSRAHAANDGGHPAPSNADASHNKGVEAANDPTIAKAPGASFSIATKPQDRDPSLLRQSPQQKGFDSLSSYHLDHNGRVPTTEFNYMQRDNLVASAQQSAVRSGNMHWVALMDLAHLASQHHMSPYSVMKFGPRGSPFAYIPITLQQPDVVETTMLRQREEELEAKAWLIAKRQSKLVKSVPMDSDDDLPVLSLPSDLFRQNSNLNADATVPNVGTKRPASLTTPPDTRARCVLRTDPDANDRQQVEQDLNQAMADSIDAIRSPPREHLAPPSHQVSSSEEDGSASPVNSDQVDLSNFDRSTKMMEIRSSSASDGNASTSLRQDGDVKNEQQTNGVAHELMTTSQAGSSVEVGGPMDKERTMAQEMEEASPTDKPAHPKSSRPPQHSSLGPLVHVEANSHGAASNESRDSSEAQHNAQQAQKQLAIKTSDTHPIHISPILSDDVLASVGQSMHSRAQVQLLKLGSTNDDVLTTLTTGERTALTERYFETHSESQIKGCRLIRLRNMLDLTLVTAIDPSANYMSQSQLAEQAARENTLAVTSSMDTCKLDGFGASSDQFSIGNLLLSSCPGKKVRLSGPVRGRGAICRDLGLDLERIFSIGVRAVVCCLNDQELSYLGAPWDEYEREADRLGLDVYRLPMAEGFAPTNVREMDATMTSIVRDCTMKGINVLVHCRGGVGRAGLIACSWLLKMGFVGERSKRGLGRLNQQQQKCVGDGIGDHSREIVERTTSNGSHDAVVGNGNGKGDDRWEQHYLSTIASRDVAREADKKKEEEEEGEEAECDTILDTVRCLIETIRRRRSPKAIETAEQVRFLVEYVTFLHRQERLKAIHSSNSNSNSS